MDVPKTGKRITLLAGCVVVVVLAAVSWRYREHIRFWWLFESIGENEQGYKEYKHRQTGVVTVQLPGGAASLGEVGIDHPPRKVTVPPFLIGKYEVSQAEWKLVMGQNPSMHRRDNFPVDSVSWEDCQQFCMRSGFTLPNSDDWEYACRGGTMTRFTFGDSIMWKQANFDGSKTGSPMRAKPVSVDSFKPNAFGLYNTHGNIWEWCQDDPYKNAGSSFAPGLRGGSWRHLADYCRSAFQDRGAPSTRSEYIGFRVAFYPLP